MACVCAAVDAGCLAGNLDAGPTCAKLVDEISASPNRPAVNMAFFKICFVIESSLISLWTGMGSRGAEKGPGAPKTCKRLCSLAVAVSICNVLRAAKWGLASSSKGLLA